MMSCMSRQGWCWMMGRQVEEQTKRLAKELYNTADLIPVHITTQGPDAYCLGNPLETLVLHQTMCMVPVYVHRMWWTVLEPGDTTLRVIRDSHLPTVSHGLLGTGRPLSARWHPGPQVVSPIYLDDIAIRNAIHIESVQQPLTIVVLDNLIVLSEGNRQWTAWQPRAWCSGAVLKGSTDNTAETHRTRTSTWWERVRQLRADVLRTLVQFPEQLCVFDEVSLVPLSTSDDAMSA